MNSKGWKVSFFALAAVVALSACSEKKKQRAGNPYAGIWISQENLQEYSSHRGELNANDRRGFCGRVSRNQDRYGDSQYRMRAMLVQANGEVFRYRAGDSVTAVGFRERNYIGTVNAAGQFLAGTIGPDGRVVANWGQQTYSRYDMPTQTTLRIQGNVLTVNSDREVLVFERHNRIVAEDYAINVTRCLSERRRVYEEEIIHRRGGGRRGPRGPVGPGPEARGPLNEDDKDFDPRLNRSGAPAPGPVAGPPPPPAPAPAPEQDLGEPDDLGGSASEEQELPPPPPRRRR